jgi:hypothetical protein
MPIWTSAYIPNQRAEREREREREREALGASGFLGAGNGAPVVREGVPELASFGGRLGPTSQQRGGGPATAPWRRAGEESGWKG